MTIDIVANIEELDPTPDEVLSEAEADRFNHRDLSAEDESSLVRELSWLRTRNHFVPSEWHLGRETQVASELKRRRDLRNQRRGGA